VLVFDIDNGHKFVRRIPTWTAAEDQEAEDVKGIAANTGTGRLYVSTTKRLAAFDLDTDKKFGRRRMRRLLRSDGSITRRTNALRALV
jgi:hypothetical protein